MDKVGAIILAAGLSRRMGTHNKLLLPIGGVPMIRHVVETYLAAIDGEACVVTGFEAPQIEAALAGMPVRFVHNAEFEKGQPFSVRAGLLAAPDAAHFLIGLGDQPQLTSDDLSVLIETHLVRDSAKISVPFRMETRGNPIVVPASLRTSLLADEANPGCGKFTRANPELSQQVLLSRPGFFHDIDTPAAFAAYQQPPLEGTMP